MQWHKYRIRIPRSFGFGAIAVGGEGNLACRAQRGQRHYATTIRQTLYSFVLALPQPYRRARYVFAVHPPHLIRMMHRQFLGNIPKLRAAAASRAYGMTSAGAGAPAQFANPPGP